MNAVMKPLFALLVLLPLPPASLAQEMPKKGKAGEDVEALLANHFGTDKVTFTLQKGDDPLRGTAWGVRDSFGHFAAYKGTYRIDCVKDALVLRLNMHRCYARREAAAGVRWEVFGSYQPKATELELSGKLPDSATVLKNQFTDADGKDMDRFDEPFTAREKREGRGERIPVHFPDFFKTGEVVKLSARDRHPLAGHLPPGFPARTKK